MFSSLHTLSHSAEWLLFLNHPALPPPRLGNCVPSKPGRFCHQVNLCSSFKIHLKSHSFSKGSMIPLGALPQNTPLDLVLFYHSGLNFSESWDPALSYMPAPDSNIGQFPRMGFKSVPPCSTDIPPWVLNADLPTPSTPITTSYSCASPSLCSCSLQIQCLSSVNYKLCNE